MKREDLLDFVGELNETFKGQTIRAARSGDGRKIELYTGISDNKLCTIIVHHRPLVQSRLMKLDDYYLYFDYHNNRHGKNYRDWLEDRVRHTLGHYDAASLYSPESRTFRETITSYGRKIKRYAREMLGPGLP